MSNIHKLRAYSMNRGIDLRMSHDERLSITTSDVVFAVNNAHTICHVMLSFEPGAYLRVKLPRWLKGTADTYLEKYLVKRFDWLVKGSVPIVTIPIVKRVDFTTQRKYTNFVSRWSKK